MALDRGDPAAAARIWERLIADCSHEEEADGLRLGYGYALVALGRLSEARELYQRLYRRSGSHIHLHQWGMVEREACEYERAATIFLEEWELIEPDDGPAQATNLYEQSLVKSLRGHRDEALALAERCFALATESEDPILYGCACRLLGDLALPDRQDTARAWFLLARQAFMDAPDPVAVTEVDARLEALQ